MGLPPLNALGHTQLDLLGFAIGRSTATVERLRHVAAYLEFCEQTLASGTPDLEYHVLADVVQLLSHRTCDAALWDWFQETARSATPERRRRMAEALFELVPDPPIIWPDLYRLWDMWFDPSTRWAVIAAYGPYPKRVAGHLRRYKAHRRREHLPVPDCEVGDVVGMP